MSKSSSNFERLGYQRVYPIDLRLTHRFHCYASTELAREVHSYYGRQVYGDGHFRFVVLDEDDSSSGSTRPTQAARTARDLLIERYENGFAPDSLNREEAKDTIVRILLEAKHYIDICGLFVLAVEKRDKEYLRKLNDADLLDMDHAAVLKVQVATLDPSLCELYYVISKKTGQPEYIYEPTGPDADMLKQRYTYHVILDPSNPPMEPLSLKSIDRWNPLYRLMSSLPPPPQSTDAALFGFGDGGRQDSDIGEPRVLEARCLEAYKEYGIYEESLLDIVHARAQLAHPIAVISHRPLRPTDLATLSEADVRTAQSAADASETERRRLMTKGFKAALDLLPPTMRMDEDGGRDSAMARYRKEYDRPTAYDHPIKLTEEWEVVSTPTPSAAIDRREERMIYLEALLRWKQIPREPYLEGRDLIAGSNAGRLGDVSKGMFSGSTATAAATAQESDERRIHQFRADASRIFAKIHPWMMQGTDILLLNAMLLELSKQEFSAGAVDTTQRERRRRLALVLDPALRKRSAQRVKRGKSTTRDESEEDELPIPTVAQLQDLLESKLKANRQLRAYLIFGAEYDEIKKKDDLYEYERHTESEVKQRIDLLTMLGDQAKAGLITSESYTTAISALTGITVEPGRGPDTEDEQPPPQRGKKRPRETTDDKEESAKRSRPD